MEHSRLLKYLLPGSGKNEMAETPTIKLQYDYKNPENVESEVPGVHKLREGPATSGSKIEIPTDNFTLSPVITVTKKEATFKKGDLKLQKVSVTEDISEENGENGVYFKREVRRQVSRGIMMKDDSTEGSAPAGPADGKKIEEKKPKTRIPKLRQTVEKLKEKQAKDKIDGSKEEKNVPKEKGSSKEKKNSTKEKKESFKQKKDEPSTVTYRRSSIPKLRDRRLASTKEETKVITKEMRNKPDEEFDKLFEDLVQNRKSQICDDFIVNTKVDDPEKVEIKFEEIVHNYEEDNQPIQIEKKPSKIPFLRHKSEQDIIVPTVDKVTRSRSTVEHHKVRNAIPKLKEKTTGSSESNEERIVTRRVTKTITTQKLMYDSDKPDEILRQKETIQFTDTTPTNTVEITEIQAQTPEEEDEETEFKFNENVKVRPGFSRHLKTIANTYKQRVNNDSEVKLTKEDSRKAEKSKDNSDIAIENAAEFNKQKSVIEIQNNQTDDRHIDAANVKDDRKPERQLNKETSVTETKHVVKDTVNDDYNIYANYIKRDSYHVLGKQKSVTEVNHTVETMNTEKKKDNTESIKDSKHTISKQNSVTDITFKEATHTSNEIKITKSIEVNETKKLYSDQKSVTYEEEKAISNNTDDEKSKSNFEREITKLKTYQNQQNKTDVVVMTSTNTINKSGQDSMNSYHVKSLTVEGADSINELEQNSNARLFETARKRDDNKNKLKLSMKLQENDSNDTKKKIGVDSKDKLIEGEDYKSTLKFSMKPKESESTVTKKATDEEPSEINIEEKDYSNDPLIVKGNVGKIVNKIEILSPETPKKEFSYDVPKKKSVLAKIAMFERQEVNEPRPPKVFLCRSKAKFTEDTTVEASNEIARKPVIVDEVLKENKTYDTDNKDQIKTQVHNVEEIKAVAEILEVLDRELEANDDENIDSEAINKVVMRPKIVSDVPVIIPRPTSIVRDPYVQRKTDYNEMEQKVEVALSIPLVVEGCKVIGEVYKPSITLQEAERDPKLGDGIDMNDAYTLPKYVKEIQQSSKTIDEVRSLPRVINKETVYERVISTNATEDKLRNPTNIVDNPVTAISKEYVTKTSARYERNISTSAVENIINKVQTSTITNINDRVLEMSNEINEFEPSIKQYKVLNNIRDKNESTLAKERSFEYHLENNTSERREEKRRYQMTEVTKEYNITHLNKQEAEKTQEDSQFFEDRNKFDHRNELDNHKTNVSKTYSAVEYSKESADKHHFKTSTAVLEDNSDILNAEDNLKRLQKLERDRELNRAKSLAELDLGDAVKGQVSRLIVRMGSVDHINVDKREVISVKERPKKLSVLEKIALFERKIAPQTMNSTTDRPKAVSKPIIQNSLSDEGFKAAVAELTGARVHYGTETKMPTRTLRNGVEMPVLAVGTALLDPKLTPYIISAAIDLGYRAFDTAFIYGNEREVGAAIKTKIDDGTVRREDLFIINKLWSTYHRQDLVEAACNASLEAMGLTYFDMYLIHNPMSFKEGSDPIPKIATVIQYSTSDYMDAWYGMERLVTMGLVRSIGVSNFNALQIARVVEKGRIKPVLNQVECHPYLSQQSLHSFCSDLGVELSCFGVLGSKGTPMELKTTTAAVIDDPLVIVMASGLHVTPAQLLIRYQLDAGHSVVVKSSSAAHLWDNLQALHFHLSTGEMEALNALNRNKRIFTFRGMGDTHKNYPFSAAF